MSPMPTATRDATCWHSARLPQGVADDDKTFTAIGLQLQPPPAIVGVLADGPARRAGLAEGDRITAINDKPVGSFADLVKLIPELAQQDPHLYLTVARGNDTLGFDVAAARRTQDGKMRWVIGVSPAATPYALERYDPLHAVSAALHETWTTTRTTFAMIGGMLSGQASTKNLSSVISIAQVANASAHMGVAWFLSFLAVISLSLGILNLLPIPILDGGHLMYYLIEAVKGSPLSERSLIAGQYVGMALLVALMGMAFYNDILRLATG